VLINGAKITAIRFSGANIGKEENGHEKSNMSLLQDQEIFVKDIGMIVRRV
jgi:hypothetical protein